jgi:hypothetical protein
MTFCREFHITPAEYPEQPADVVVKWRQMWAAEVEGETMRRKIEEARAKARQH